MVTLDTMKNYYNKFKEKADKYEDAYYNTGKTYYLTKYHEYRELYEITEKAIISTLSKIGEA